jgi:hypothetical protein
MSISSRSGSGAMARGGEGGLADARWMKKRVAKAEAAIRKAGLVICALI